MVDYASGFIRSRLASTDEQAKTGISLEAQIASLRAWAKREGHYIAGEYIDAGISGKRPPAKRPELSRFFNDVENGLQVDCLCFAKLDRFFRSVKLYYQAMEFLDKHKLAWQAIQEDYETVTASGRMKVNIMLSVAENEADRTAERIKAVFDRKIEKGEAITRCQPFGYTVKNKKVEPDENAPIVQEMFAYFAATGNTYATRDMIQDKYGIRLNYESVYRFLQNTIYIGRYRDNPNYCEPLIDVELFERVQAEFAERRKTKRAPSGRIYLFSGLIVCAECGRKMTVSYNKASTLQPVRYRCPAHLMEKTCGNTKNVSEVVVESELLRIAAASVAGQKAEYNVAERSTPSVNKSTVKQKMTRLKELYIDGDITKAEYTNQMNKLKSLLETPKQKAREPIRLFGNNFLLDYAGLTQEQKRKFWHSVLDHITADIDHNLDVYFLP